MFCCFSHTVPSSTEEVMEEVTVEVMEDTEEVTEEVMEDTEAVTEAAGAEAMEVVGVELAAGAVVGAESPTLASSLRSASTLE
jgi:ABC-type transporter MlaC component